MKYLTYLVVFVITVFVFTTSPVIAGDAFSDLFSQTKICFSHIAIADGWETEVAVLNPTAKPVTGNFTFYDKSGNQLGGAVSQTLNPFGRYQVEVGASYVRFTSDQAVVGFFLNGFGDNSKLDGSKAL